jgi:predicted ABC-type ATPase
VTPILFVLAGVNGAGKSSVGGAFLRSRHLDYFNPDEAATRIRELLRCSAVEANASCVAPLRSLAPGFQPGELSVR